MKDCRGKDKDGAKNLQSSIVLPISISIPSNSQASIAVVSINNFDSLSLSPWLTDLHSHATTRIWVCTNKDSHSKIWDWHIGDVIPSVDMLFVRFLEKHVDGQSSSGCIIYLIDFLPRGGFSQTYTLIRDRSRAVWNNFTIPFFFYPKLKRS